MTRILSGTLLLVAVAAAVWLLDPLFLLFIAVGVALLAFREYAALAARAGAQVPKGATGMAVALTVVAVGIPGLPVEAVLAGTTLGLASLALAAALSAQGSSEPAGALQNASISTFAPLYLGLPLGLMAATRWTLGREAVLLLIVTIVLSDTFQYYGGRLLGRRRLAPVISPKKTIEGAVAGLVGAVLSLAIIGHFWLPQMGLSGRIVLGLAIAVVGIIGDLFESLLKRSVDLKDASSMIPGHGGMLDRIDALLFAAPVFYVFVRYSY